MPNQLQQRGGAQPSKPVRYGVLWTNRFYDGIVTQRSPIRDASSHLEEAYYGSRGNVLYDGLNCEVSSKLTFIRRPGHSSYNASTFPAINRFYENRTNTYNATQTIPSENIQVVADTASVIYDCTGPSTKKTLFTKTAGAGSTYFQSVGNSMYFTNGTDLKKLLTSEYVWASNTVFNAGQFIIDTNGNIQEFYVPASGGLTETITAINVSQPTHSFTRLVVLTLASPLVLAGPSTIFFTLAGLTTETSLNGAVFQFSAGAGSYSTLSFSYGSSLHSFPPLTSGTVSETGTASYSTTSGTTGSVMPTWNATPGGLTADETFNWQNMGNPVENWQIAPPLAAPSLGSSSSYSFWSSSTSYPQYTAILDSNSNIEIAVNAGGKTGSSIPVWSAFQYGTSDGSVYWVNYGKPSVWAANYESAFYYQNGSACIVDTNGNIQYLIAAGVSGATEPTWATSLGAQTVDNTDTWVCAGPGVTVATSSYQWAYSYHGVDGSLSTASPIAEIYTGILGTSPSPSILLSGLGTTDPQCDQIWIWRTVQGGSVLFFDGSVPNPGAGTSVATPWTYTDTVPDVSTNGGPSLNEFIEAPIALSSNPPPVGLTSLTYHLGCIFGAVGNLVQYSDGPLVTSGNGNTAWNPGNVFVFPSTVVRLFPTSSGLIVFTSSDIYIIQGQNTTSSPLFAAPFLQYIGLVSYDAFAVNGSIVFLYTSDNQVITLDPSSGVSEVGFPIGDQFGPGYGTGTFNPTSAHITWHIAQSQDKGLYVSDFTSSWWRMCPTPSPETGTTWSPRALIATGFSAVQSVETTPGTHNLLLGPQTSGPILQRNYQVYSDNGSAYSAWAVLGSLVLAQPGQLAMVESLTTDSIAIGTPITLGVQLDEISAYTGLGSVLVNAGGTNYAVGDLESISGGTGGIYKVTSISGGGSTGPVNGLTVVAPGLNYPASQTGAATSAITGAGTGLTVNTTSGGLFEALLSSVQDPTQKAPSITLYAQRFYISQTQQPAVCRHLQILVNWGTDTVKNELLSLSLYGGFESEK